MSSKLNNLREFGGYLLDLEKRCLWFAGQPVRLPLKAIELLILLVEHNGQIVTKEEIWEALWQDTFVEETNLTHNIYLLRKALKDIKGENPIQTIPRRGYRFSAEIRHPDIILERHASNRTSIEVEEIIEENVPPPPKKHRFYMRIAVTGAIAVAVLAGIAITAWNYGARMWPANPPIRSIAVLPFRTIAPDTDDKHSGLIMADILITRLSNIRELNVRPTSTVMSDDLLSMDSSALAAKLKVDAVLEGTIHRDGDQVRVTARLVRSGDNYSIWAGQFENTTGSVSGLPEEIALRVVDALTLTLSQTEHRALTRRYMETEDAYRLYIQGRYEWNKRTELGIGRAVYLFRQAIEKDPNFALAYAGLADAINISNSDRAEGAALIERALKLDPDLAEAYASLGFQQMFHYWDWNGAEISFKRSIELNPGYATAHHWYATLLAIKGKNDEARAEMNRAIEIDPLSYNFIGDMGQLYYFSRDYKKAEEYSLKALEINPEFVFAYLYLYNIYLKTGENEKAVESQIRHEQLSSFKAIETENIKALQNTRFENLRKLFREGGLEPYWQQVFLRYQETPGVAYSKAAVYVQLGEKEKALDMLETAYRGQAFMMAFVKADPIFDSIRDEPRYREILQKMKLE